MFANNFQKNFENTLAQKKQATHKGDALIIYETYR